MNYHSKCNNCEAVHNTEELVPLANIKDLGERLTPGKTVPSGECKDCGSLCYPYDLPALTLEDPFNQDESGRREYLMTSGYKSVWISVGNASVHIIRMPETEYGVVVELSKRGKEAE